MSTSFAASAPAIEPLVGLRDARLLADLWKHPLLEDKYGELVISRELLTQLTQMIVTQRAGPSLALRSTLLLTVGMSSGPSPLKMIDWRGNITIARLQLFAGGHPPRGRGTHASRACFAGTAVPTHMGRPPPEPWQRR